MEKGSLRGVRLHACIYIFDADSLFHHFHDKDDTIHPLDIDLLYHNDRCNRRGRRESW